MLYTRDSVTKERTDDKEHKEVSKQYVLTITHHATASIMLKCYQNKYKDVHRQIEYRILCCVINTSTYCWDSTTP